MSLMPHQHKRAPMAVPDDDDIPPDDDNNPGNWETLNDYSQNELTCGGRPLSPGASYIVIKTDLSNLQRLEEFDQVNIASGFFSEVYKVTHRTTKQVMVLKKNIQLSNCPNVLLEIQLLNQVHHPNMIKFLGVLVQDGQLHALTEYINHGSLRQLICDYDTMFPWPVRLGLAQDIADGMSYLHRLRIVHRDLTSLNCLIRKRGSNLSAIVSDLGLATKLPDNQDEKMSTVGSPFWIAPESLRGKVYNETADIFSYGIILCEMIARITADPEVLPRLENFGLDKNAFSDMVRNTSCPEAFLQLACQCCEMTPTARPGFKNIVIKIENISTEFNSNNNDDKTPDGYPKPRKSRSQSTVQPPRLNFHTICSVTTRQRPIQLKRCNSDKGPRKPIVMIKTPVNPFNTPDLQGGRVKLRDSLAHTDLHYSFELETLDDVNLLLMQGCHNDAPIEEKRGRMKKRISQSLPSSPEMNRKMIQDQENSFAEELEDREFEDTFLQDGPVDLTQAPKRRSLLIRDYSMPPRWMDELHKPRSRSADNFNDKLDSGVGSFGSEETDIADGISRLQLSDNREVFEAKRSDAR